MQRNILKHDFTKFFFNKNQNKVQKIYKQNYLNKDEVNSNLIKMKQFCNLLQEDNTKINTKIIFENVI